MVAEQAPLPAAEGMIGDGHGDGDVDAHHAHLDTVGEIARRIAIAGEDGDAIAVFVLVDHLDRIGIGRRADDREDGAEDLLAVDGHLGRDAVEQRAADVVSLFIALQRETAAVDDEFGAFGDALVDIAQHLVAVRAGDQRTHLGVLVCRRANLEAFDTRFKALDQRIGGGLAHRHGDRDGHAALPSGPVPGPHQSVGCLVQIRIGEDHHVVFSPAQRLHAFSRFRATLIDIFRDGRGAHKAHRLDVGMIENVIDGFLVAMDDAQHAFG